jgi:hypothetical protein
MDRDDARAILARANVPPDVDFHTLGSDQVTALLKQARLHRYRESKNAPGSRARMFCQYLQRVANRPA